MHGVDLGTNNGYIIIFTCHFLKYQLSLTKKAMLIRIVLLIRAHYHDLPHSNTPSLCSNVSNVLFLVDMVEE